MNVTLALDDHLVERARKLAAARGMSLNHMIRQELELLTGGADRQRTFASLKRLLSEQPGDSGGWAWNREEIHDRALLR